MAQSPAQYGPVDGAQSAHNRILFLAMQLAANEERAEHRHQRDGEDRGADHGEGLGEGERMEHLAFHAGEREDGNEGQNDDDHGEGDGPAHKPGGVQRDFPDVLAIVAVFLLVLLGLADDVFCHHNARVDQHADGNGDAAQRHDVRRDARALHEQKCAEHSKRQRNRDDEDAAEVPEEQDVRQRDQR